VCIGLVGESRDALGQRDQSLVGGVLGRPVGDGSRVLDAGSSVVVPTGGPLGDPFGEFVRRPPTVVHGTDGVDQAAVVGAFAVTGCTSRGCNSGRLEAVVVLVLVRGEPASTACAGQSAGSSALSSRIARAPASTLSASSPANHPSVMPRRCASPAKSHAIRPCIVPDGPVPEIQLIGP